MALHGSFCALRLILLSQLSLQLATGFMVQAPVLRGNANGLLGQVLLGQGARTCCMQAGGGSSESGRPKLLLPSLSQVVLLPQSMYH